MRKLSKFFKYLLVLISHCMLLSCHLNGAKQRKAHQPDTLQKTPVSQQHKTKPQTQVDDMIFVAYLDDGDYFQLLARKGDLNTSFINESDTSRNLNRGDVVRITWKNGTVTIPGDGDAEMPAKLLISIKKIADGPVPKFRKTYNRKIKYTWPTDEHYTTSYLDKLYIIIEYYLAKTRNPLLQIAINNHDEITYSIESRERGGRSYKVIGVAPVGPNGSNVVQWLYIDEESGDLYDYDLPNDELIKFN